MGKKPITSGIFLGLLIKTITITKVCFMSSLGNAAELSGKTVEVYDTGGIGLRAWTETCSGTYVNKADGTRGTVTSATSQLCSSYNRWKIKWPSDATERWSAEDWLRVIPPDLTISGSVTVSPSSPVAGEEVTVSCTIQNIGQGNAIPSATKILLLRVSPFAIVNTIDFIETAKVDISSSIQFSHKFYLPDDLPGGKYRINVEVDSQTTTGETNFANNVKQSSEFTVKPIFNVSGSAGSGGTVSPNGTFSVVSGNNVTFTAMPNSTYAVKEWQVDGTFAQSGGTTFVLNNVTSDKNVAVSFSRLYDLTVVVNGQGDFSLSPSGGKYPAGTQITATATPQPGYQFSEWSGVQSSRSISFSFAKGGLNETLNLHFIGSIIPQNLNLGVAQSTPATVGINMPTPTSWWTLCEVCENLESPLWQLLFVLSGQNPSGTIHLPNGGGINNFVRSTYIPQINTAPFLNFPVPGVQPNEAPVTAIMDHCVTPNSGLYLSYDKDHNIRTHQGSTYVVLPVNQGRLKDFAVLPNGVKPSTLFTYTGISTPGQNGPGYLQYDGHPGYDYGYDNVDVYAAAPGVVMVDSDFVGSNLAGKNIATYYMENYHALIIRHDNDYCSIYMHLSDINSGYVDKSDPLKWKPKKATVPINNLHIGKSGDFNAKFPIDPHLHFELWRLDSGSEWNYADPYGYSVPIQPSGTQVITPYLWK